MLAAALLLGGGAITAAACSDEAARPTFESPDAESDAAAGLPDSSVPDVVTPPEERDPYDPTPAVVTCAAGAASSACAMELAAGAQHVCARMNDGTVRCWGDDTRGSLGARAPRPDGGAGDAGDAGADAATDGGASAVNTVYGLSNVTQISAAAATTCARLADGGVVCWGGNTDGLLGLSNKGAPVRDEDAHPTPSSITLPSAAARVDVGPSVACAVLTAGPVVCWGRDDFKQLARAPFDAGDSYPPIGLPAQADLATLKVAQYAGGTFSGLALTANGEVWSWGALAGDEGLVSGRVSSVSPDRLARRIVQLEKVTSFAVSPNVTPEQPPPEDDGNGFGTFGIGIPGFPEEPKPHAHACAIAGGEVYCWGKSERGALCSGIPDPSQVPLHAPVRAKAWPQQLSVGDESTCARMTDGTVMCCGDDTRGRLGTGKLAIHSAFFTKAEAFTGRAVQVVSTSYAVCALVQGGTVECWGDNRHGELARKPDALDHPSPSKVVF